MSARSLIQLYRNINPKMLHRKDRGKPTESQQELSFLQYGQSDTKSFVPGAEIIPEKIEKEKEEKENQDGWESCSESEAEDDSDGEWVDVYHSSDEDEKKEMPEETPEEMMNKQKLAEEVSATRIMTDEDFKAINQRQISKTITAGKSPGSISKAKKRKRDEVTENNSELPSLGDIEMVHKKRAHDKESRLATVMAGREGREKFAHGPSKMNPHASTSNKDKLKKKTFNMIKHKIRRKKVKRSFKEKQIALRNSLLKRSKNARK